MIFDKENIHYTLNGILFVVLFAFAAMYIGEIPWLQKIGLGPLVVAMFFGIIYSNTLQRRLPADWVPGVEFVSRNILPVAIVLYGFRITFQEVLYLGLDAFLINCIVVASTLLLGYIAGVKFLKLDRKTALLISTGAAICGSAAILAMEKVIRADRAKTTIAVATVILFSTISMFFYPLLQHLGFLGFTTNEYGLFIGATVHELGQALVAGVHVSEKAGNVSLIVKMTRVLMLAPALIIISSLSVRRPKKIEDPQKMQRLQKIQKLQKKSTFQKIRNLIPWFALIFVLVVCFNSLDLIPHKLLRTINRFDTFLLTMVMVSVGMETNLKKIQEIGLKPLYLAAGLFFWLMISVYFLVYFSPIR